MSAPRRSRLATSLNTRFILFVGAIVLLALSLIEIFELVELPFEGQVGRFFVSSSFFSLNLVTSLMVTLGYAGLFALMFLESASLPVPSEVVLPFAGYLAFTGQMNIVVVLVVSTVASVAGALLDYFLALWLGRPIVLRVFKWAGVRADHLDAAEKWLDSKGSLSILVARFVPVLRSVISLPAGAVKMKLSTFTLMTALGGFGWSLFLVYLGYSAGLLWQGALASSSSVLTDVGLACVAAGSGAYVVYFLARRYYSKVERDGLKMGSSLAGSP